MDAAMPSITSTNDVRVIDASYTSCIVQHERHRNTAVDRRQALPDRIDERLAAGARAPHQQTSRGAAASDGAGPLKLATRDGQYAIGGGGFCDTVLPHVIDDADHLAPRRVRIGTDPLTQRRRRRAPQLDRQILRHDGHGPQSRRDRSHVYSRPAIDARPRRPEVVGRHVLEPAERAVPCHVRRVALGHAAACWPTRSRSAPDLPIGIAFVSAMAVTPGIVAKCLQQGLVHLRGLIRRRRDRSLESRSGPSARPSVSNPGTTPRSARNVRIISPELTSSTSASATCATTSPLRVRCRSRLSLAPRAPASIPDSCRPAYLNAGISPKRIPDRIETSSGEREHAGIDR